MRIKDTLLLIGDINSSRAELRDVFSGTYSILEAESKEQGLFLLEQNIHCIAAVLLDISLPKTRKDSVIPKMRALAKDTPIIVIIDQDNMLYEITAYDLGADDVIIKPYNPTGIFKRVQTIVELSIHKSDLENMVQEQAGIIRSSNEAIVDLLTSIIEYRSTETKHHAMRLRKLTKILMEKVAEIAPEYDLSQDTINTVVRAVSLHDIGKVSIPDNILNKPSRLTDEEFEIIKKHTVNGADILKNLKGFTTHNYLKLAYNICLYHHERWDGNGYPYGLKGNEIPICAQVAGLVDAYDALTSQRVYKDAYSYTQAENMIFNGECGVFSPLLLECFKEVKDQFKSYSMSYADHENSSDIDITEPLPGPNIDLIKGDSRYIMQEKYQTLLHYIDCPIMEIDLNSGSYHIVYNPDPDLNFQGDNANFEEAMKKFSNASVHPDDKEKANSIVSEMKKAFLGSTLRKQDFSFRVYSPFEGIYIKCKLSAFRIHESSHSNSNIMILWHIDSNFNTDAEETVNNDFASSLKKYKYSILDSLIDNPICFINDNKLTLVGGYESLYKLLGYTYKDITEKFNNSFLEIISFESREAFLDSIKEHIKYGERSIESDLYLNNKNGESIKVHNRSCLFEDEKGIEHFCTSLSNVSDLNSKNDNYQSDFDKSIELLKHSDDIFFEIDLIKNVFYCSDKIKKRFGYEPIKENFLVDIFRRSHIHPDDLNRIREAIKNLDDKDPIIDFELRICDSDGIYTWNNVKGSIQKDYSGKAIRILGALIDINKGMQISYELKQQAEKDSLTGLYNKETSRLKIEEYLLNSTDNIHSALIMIDLDNFKSINDTYGHLFGDTVLTHTASELKKYFRSNDIISRVGGDEFLIFVKNISDKSIIENRCSVLLDSIQNLFGIAYANMGLSCSIGAVLVPEHGRSFSELYEKADQALYQAKARGKNNYVIYDIKENYANINLSGITSTRIDSNEEPCTFDNNLSYYLFRKLYISNDIYKSINEIIEEVGKNFNVSRVYIFENSDDNSACSNTFEWCNEGIHAEINNLQDLSYIEGPVKGWQDVFNERGLFYCPDVDKLQDRFRQVLEPQKVKSLLQCAIHDKGVFRGFIGFDECINNRVWTNDQTEFLFFLSQIVSIFLFNERNKEKASQTYNNLCNIFDSVDKGIYVINKDKDLLFANKKAYFTSAVNDKNGSCYKVLKNRKRKCIDCPVENAIKNDMKLSEKDKSFHPFYGSNCRITKTKWSGCDAYVIIFD